MMTQNPDQLAAKRIFLFKNGQPNFPGKMMVVNNRQIRDFNSFLVQATGGLKTTVAIRNIYTPMTGTKVSNLEQLKTGQHYVAGGTERFRREKYEGNSTALLPKRRQYQPFHVPPRLNQAVVASARYKKPTEKPIAIHVYRNGEEKYHGIRILLTKRGMLTMDKVLEAVTEKTEMFTPAKRLYTVEGQLVESVDGIQNKAEYVASEGTKAFAKAAYARDVPKDAMNKSTSPNRRLLGLRSRHPFQDGRLSDARVNVTQEESTSPSRHPNRYLRIKPPVRVPPLRAGKKFTRKERPMGGRKDKEAREIALKDTREDSMFGGSPVQSRSTHRMPSPPGPAPAQPQGTPAANVVVTEHKSPQRTPQPSPQPPGPSIPSRQDDVSRPSGVNEELEEPVEDQVDVEPTRDSPSTDSKPKQEEPETLAPPPEEVGEDVIEEDIEQVASAHHPEMLEFQSQDTKQTVDLSVRRQDSNGSPVEDLHPVSDDRQQQQQQQQQQDPLSQPSKSSIRSRSEGNLQDVSRSSIRSDTSTKSKKSGKLSNNSKGSVQTGSQNQRESNAGSGRHSPVSETRDGRVLEDSLVGGSEPVGRVSPVPEFETGAKPPSPPPAEEEEGGRSSRDGDVEHVDEQDGTGHSNGSSSPQEV